MASLNTSQSSDSLSVCGCISGLQKVCASTYGGSSGKLYHNAFSGVSNNYSYNSELGRMLYTISVLLMFAFVILLLMVRSIKRSNSTVEVESLLESMRFREELDIQQRQKRRLQKAKNKVSAWLSRGKMWSDPRGSGARQGATMPSKRPIDTFRTNSLQSGCSYLPEIVISNSDDGTSPSGRLSMRQNSCTPSLSLLYDFEGGAKETSAGWSRKNSGCSSCSETGDLSVSDLTFNSSLDLTNSVAGNGTSMLYDESLSDEAIASVLMYSNCLASEAYAERRGSSPRLRPASADCKMVGHGVPTVALQLSPQPLQATPSPTATTPLAPNQLPGAFFPSSSPIAKADSRNSLQLIPNYYTLATGITHATHQARQSSQTLPTLNPNLPMQPPRNK